jgi:ArsR family transcriptional regulator
MRDLLRALRALSDETRLRMLNLLLQRECCVCEVMAVLGISQTRASRNLGILYDAGFLRQRRQGLWSFYAVDREAMPGCCAVLLESFQTCATGNASMQADRQKLAATDPVAAACCAFGKRNRP